MTNSQFTKNTLVAFSNQILDIINSARAILIYMPPGTQRKAVEGWIYHLEVAVNDEHRWVVDTHTIADTIEELSNEENR